MIRWISEKLGTAPAFDPSITKVMTIVDVRDLVDKSGNSPAAAREKIEQGLTLLQQGKQVVICCDYGISRSNAIAVGILSRFKKITLDSAIREVIQAIGPQEIKLELLRSVRTALQTDVENSSAAESRILITGGTGLIGQALINKISTHFHIVAPSRNELDLTAGALNLDLLVKEHRINCIIHLANPRVYTSNRAIGETLVLLRNVLDVCRENKTRLIFPSSWELYAYRTAEIITDEHLPVFPRGPYGETKLLCETLIEHHRRLYGLQCGLVRSSPIYSETGDRPKFLYNFIDKAQRNVPIKTHCYLNGYPKLDLLYIDDFIAAFERVIETGFVGTLNIGTGHTVSTHAIAEYIVNEIGSSSTVGSLDIEDYCADITMDISPARKALGWQPLVSWEKGIDRLLAIQQKK